MTIELAKILTDIKSAIGDWNAGLIHTERDFFIKLKGLNCRLHRELKKQPMALGEVRLK